MSYFVVHEAGRIAPYTVYEGKANVPGTRQVVACTQTLRGAKKAIRQDQESRARQGADGAVYRVLEYADLPDLRLSELAQ